MEYINKIMEKKVSRKKFISILGGVLLVFFLFPKSVLANVIGMRFNKTGSTRSFFDSDDNKYHWYIDGAEVMTLEAV